MMEFEPETRAVLRGVAGALAATLGSVELRVLPSTEDERPFDGEAYIESNLGTWRPGDLVFLDPFAMWRDPADQDRRDRYRRIVDRVASPTSPELVLFWTWGRAFPAADGDLAGTSEAVRNGYQELRGVLHAGDRHFIRVTWRRGLQFVMWVTAPAPHLESLGLAIDRSCARLVDHLEERGCDDRLSHAAVEVAID